MSLPHLRPHGCIGQGLIDGAVRIRHPINGFADTECLMHVIALTPRRGPDEQPCPPNGKIRVAGGQGPDGMQMIRQQHYCHRIEWPFAQTIRDCIMKN